MLLVGAGGALGTRISAAGAAERIGRATVIVDSDQDGYSDDVETLWGTDPQDPNDHPPEVVALAAAHDVVVVPDQMAAEAADLASALPNGLDLQTTLTNPVTGAAVTTHNPMSGLKSVLGFDPTTGLLSDPLTGAAIDASAIVDPVTGRPIGSNTHVSGGQASAPVFLDGRGPDSISPYADSNGGDDGDDRSVGADKKPADDPCDSWWERLTNVMCGGPEQPDPSKPHEPTYSERGCTIIWACTCPEGYFDTAPYHACTRPSTLPVKPPKMTSPDSPDSETPSTATGAPPAPNCPVDGCGTGGTVEPGTVPDTPTVDPYANWAPDGGSIVVLVTGSGTPPTSGCATDGPGCSRPDITDGFVSLLVGGLGNGTNM